MGNAKASVHFEPNNTSSAYPVMLAVVGSKEFQWTPFPASYLQQVHSQVQHIPLATTTKSTRESMPLMHQCFLPVSFILLFVSGTGTQGHGRCSIVGGFEARLDKALVRLQCWPCFEQEVAQSGLQSSCRHDRSICVSYQFHSRSHGKSKVKHAVMIWSTVRLLPVVLDG